MKKKVFLHEIKKNWMLCLMALPAVLCLFVFNYVPMAGLVMAFQRMDFRKGIFTSPFVGLDNFKFLFATTDAWIITRNTVCYNVVFLALALVCSVSLALLINELRNKLFAKTIQTIFIMPHFLSMVVISMIVYAFLGHDMGYVNNILMDLGHDKIYWYNTKEAWPPLLVLIYLWHHVGFSSVVYTAVISGISNEYYEAAVLDGATRFQQAKYITIPHLKTIVCINLIRGVGGMFRSDFGLFYSVPQDSGALYSVTNTLDTYVYRGITSLGNFGMSTAAGLYQSVVGFILVLVANKIVDKIDSESALF